MSINVEVSLDVSPEGAVAVVGCTEALTGGVDAPPVDEQPASVVIVRPIKNVAAWRVRRLEGAR